MPQRGARGLISDTDVQDLDRNARKAKIFPGNLVRLISQDSDVEARSKRTSAAFNVCESNGGSGLA